MNILIVEDDPLNRALLEGYLSETKLPISSVQSAESLSAAMECLEKDIYDVVLLDLNLPDSKDLDTLKRVIDKHPYVAIIIITGEFGEDLGLKAVASGAQEYLLKASFTKEDLAKSIYYAIERKRAQEEVRLANMELEKTNHELKEMQSQLVQNEKMASIGQLAAGVAHELNTPVGFVAGNFQALEKYLKKILTLLTIYDEIVEKFDTSGNPQIQKDIDSLREFKDEKQIDFILEDIQRIFDDSKEGLGRTTNIIQNLRDFSRIDRPGSRENFNLNDGIKATLVVAKNEIKYDIDVKTELSEIPSIFCHSGQINQVMLNIIVNAAQAIKDQEREDRGTITIRTFYSDDLVVCEISDDGPGISPEKVSKVFDPFFTTKPPGKGTGLGLSVSYDIIVNKHNGKLLVDSTVGKGTKFTIKLPISTKENEEEVLSDGQKNSVVCG